MVSPYRSGSSMRCIGSCCPRGGAAANSPGNSVAAKTGSAAPDRRMRVSCRPRRIKSWSFSAISRSSFRSLHLPRPYPGCLSACPVRDHSPLPRRQRPPRTASYYADALRGRSSEGADPLPQPLLQNTPIAILRAASNGSGERRLGGLADFFLEGVIEVSRQGVSTAHRLIKLFEDGPKQNNSPRANYDIRTARSRGAPEISNNFGPLHRKSPQACKTDGTECTRSLAEPRDSARDDRKRRDRLYEYTRYMEILDEGTEPLPR